MYFGVYLLLWEFSNRLKSPIPNLYNINNYYNNNHLRCYAMPYNDHKDNRPVSIYMNL